MKRSINKYLILSILIFGFVTACMLDQGPVYINPCPCDITQYKDCDCDPDTIYEISFQDDIIPYLTEFCVACHSEECKYVNFKKGKAYENIIRYVNLDNPEGSVVYQSVIMDFMPPLGGYTADSTLVTIDMIPPESETKKLYYWIEQGARNN